VNTCVCNKLAVASFVNLRAGKKHNIVRAFKSKNYAFDTVMYMLHCINVHLSRFGLLALGVINICVENDVRKSARH